MHTRMRYLLLSLLILFFSCACSAANAPNTVVQSSTGKGSQGSGLSYGNSSIAHLHLPPGFQISVYASGLHRPRFMTIGPNEVLLVAYVSEASSIARMALGNELKVGSIQRIITSLPSPGDLPYSAQTVLIGPDNHIYISIGSDCNACIEKDPHLAAVWQYNMDGSQGRLYAKGLWNAVGMAVNPWMGQIWVDINERDVMGESIPPEAVYGLVDQGDYGWPRCYAGVIPNPKFGQSADACKGVQRPIVTLQAHSAPLGLAFYPLGATQFPERYRNSLYVALHGSGNSSMPAGYKIVRIPIDCGKMAGHVEDFLTGLLNSAGTSSVRPTGITFAPDGSMFISDDQAGLIYHVWYQST